MTENAATTLLFVTTSFRMVNFYSNRSRYVKVIKFVDDELRQLMSLRVGDEKVKQIVASSVSYQRKLTASFWAIALITGNLMCVNSAVRALLYAPEVGEAAPMILQSWFPFSDRSKHFWVAFAVQYYVMNLGMLIVPCWHSFIVAIEIFVIAKLKVLSLDLSRLGVDAHAELARCVDERQKLSDFVKELSALVSGSLFLDFVVFSGLICALLFQASQVFSHPMSTFEL